MTLCLPVLFGHWQIMMIAFVPFRHRNDDEDFMHDHHDNIQKAAKALRDADALLITAGAGIGVDSGLPDFRGKEGFWKAYPALARLGKSFTDIADPESFKHNPELAWAFYGHRLRLYRTTQPHDGFRLLLEAAMMKKYGYFVFTSNVDGQFQSAGYAMDRIVECHGSIHHLQCTLPCCQEIWSAEHTKVMVDENEFVAQQPLPHCFHCEEIARPNILMFGDYQWIGDRTMSQAKRYQQWITQLLTNRARLVVVELGAGIAVPSVRFESEDVARRHGATMIRINPHDSDVRNGQISIPLGALAGIQAIGNV